MIGIIGLGKMGYNMAFRLVKSGEKVVVYNRSPEKVDTIAKEGAIPSYTYKEFFQKLEEPRIIWMMLPHKIVDDILMEIKPFIKKGDIFVDGGNSNYKESMRRHNELSKDGIMTLDVGVSGGLVAAKRGYCMMVGGDKKAYDEAERFIKKMCIENGFGYFGEAGTGHFVKMVHNAIEYGMMQSIGEGFDLIKNGPFKDVDLKRLSGVWNNGSIIQGLLMEMTFNSFKHHGNDLKDTSGVVAESGEGRWAVQAAIEHKVPFTANSYALWERFRTKSEFTFGNKLLAVIRDEFGGHGFKKK